VGRIVLNGPQHFDSFCQPTTLVLPTSYFLHVACKCSSLTTLVTSLQVIVIRWWNKLKMPQDSYYLIDLGW
jgi:hypothetical protein